jgi:hypothetical protein
MSRLNKMVMSLVVLVTLAISLTLVVATEAEAATAVSKSGVPGATYEPSQPASCFDNVFARVKQLGVYGPTVYAAALGNGSRSQYVTWRTDVTDRTTGVTAVGSWSAWALATTTTPVKLAEMDGNFTLFHPLGVRVHILWWDPISKTYTGTLDYTINGYYNYDYSPVQFSTSSC